jgi:hypothetical protein
MMTLLNELKQSLILAQEIENAKLEMWHWVGYDIDYQTRDKHICGTAACVVGWHVLMTEPDIKNFRQFDEHCVQICHRLSDECGDHLERAITGGYPEDREEDLRCAALHDDRRYLKLLEHPHVTTDSSIGDAIDFIEQLEHIREAA